jgi:starch phosphorylase
MQRGRLDPDSQFERFSMTVLALRSAARRNGVSQLHGKVSKEMWGGVGLTMSDAEPVAEMDAITNGVHTATWVGPEMSALFDRDLGTDWRTLPDLRPNWSGMPRVASADLWAARTAQRARLLERVDAMSKAEGFGGLHPDVTADRALVFGFARRFATYKRAGLILSDPDRLARLMEGISRPIVVVFAGKAHPRDDPGKLLVQRIVKACREDERFRGRLVFLENYDIEIARLLVQGSDVWLNTPRRPQEASGTSGMKATLNGALHLSELDGWWDEAYAPGLGWALGEGIARTGGEAHDAEEARQLMALLEDEILPLFFKRDGARRADRVARTRGQLDPGHGPGLQRPAHGPRVRRTLLPACGRLVI